ncbi:MAG: RNA polymerase sigma factor [Solirubrobacterales bacterium]|nr:RNA polymerase sigma factor [Solirubrobacterales bacterium]
MQSDSRLVKLFRRGVEPAFDELVHRYRAALVAYAGAIAGRDRAEDVVQDSLVKAHRCLAGDQSIEPKPWFYTVVRNTALNDLRDNRKHSHDNLGETMDRGFQQPHEVAERREEFAAVVAAVSALPTSQRRALIGHELGGFSNDEIAAELDVSPGATKQLIYRARLSLRNSFGALIPFPLIAWLASDASSLFATGAAGGAASGAAATGALGASGGTVGSATTGGVFGGLAGAGSTKLALVAIVASGSIAGGVAAERHHDSSRDTAPETVVKTYEGSTGGAASGNAQGTPSIIGGTPGSKHGSSGADDGKSGGGRNSSGSGESDDHSIRQARNEEHRGAGHGKDERREPRPEGSHRDDSGPGSGGSGYGSHPNAPGAGDDSPRPPNPAGEDGSSGTGSGESGSGSSGSGSDDAYPGDAEPLEHESSSSDDD